MTRAIWMLVALATLGCRSYAHRATHHAPGLTDLTTPLDHENGDPVRYEQPTDPGSETLMVAVAPYIGGTFEGNGSVELGTELRFERHTSPTAGLLARSGFAITAGVGFIRFEDHAHTPGAFYGELNYRFLIKDTFPADVGVGPALYSGELDPGGQISLRVTMLLVRFRYMANTGSEFMLGFELPIPFFFSRSR